MLRLLSGLLILGSLIIIGLSLYTFLIYTHPKRYITPITPQDLHLDFEKLSFKTSDNITLSGWFIPNKDSDAVIIICHGYPADKGDVLALASFLRRDYNLFFFDFRGMGESGGSSTTLGHKEKIDLISAIEYVKKRDFNKIGAFGFSMGGAVIIMSNSSYIRAAVSDSAFSSLDRMVHVLYANFGWMRFPFIFLTNLYARFFIGANLKTVSPLESMKDLRFPLFIIHAESDEVIPVENAYLLHNANPKSKLWIIPGALHGQTYSIRRSEYEDKITRFFKAYL